MLTLLCSAVAACTGTFDVGAGPYETSSETNAATGDDIARDPLFDASAGPRGSSDDAGSFGYPDAGDGLGAPDAGAPPADTAFSGPSVCTSDELWTFGDRESPLMHPGRACIDCHGQKNGPDLSLAGTVFPTGHEPDDCLGVDGKQARVEIEVLDAEGNVITMTANENGNFFSQASIAFPITAKVRIDGKERAMGTKVSSGDCNGCHTENGANNAPGRIALP